MDGSTSVKMPRLVLSLLGTVAVLGVSQPALAQDAAVGGGHPPAGSDGGGVKADRGAEVQEVVVTATRRETTIQNTPMVVNAISGSQLSRTNARSITDVIGQVPALTVQDQGPGQERYVIRNITAPGEPEVGLYLDEIPIAGFTGENTDAGGQQPDVKLWDMNRIEVLQGPQGTLYGAGSEGGAIRIISERPDMNTFGGVLSGTASTLSTGGTNSSVDGTLNIPIVSDKLAVRINAYDDHDAGYIDEYYLKEKNVNHVDTSGGRFNLRAKPADGWTVDFIAYYQETKFGDLFNINPQFAKVAGTPWVAANFVRMPGEDRFQAYNLISSYELPWATLTATASYQQRSMVNHKDSTVTHNFSCPDRDYVVCQPIDAVRSRLEAGKLRAYIDDDGVKSWSSELRLSSKESGPLKWTVGGFFQQRDNTFELTSGLADAQGDYNGEPARTKFQRANQDSTRQIAGFGEATYDLIGGLSATAGIRVFNVERSLASQALVPAAVTPTPTTYYSETSETYKFMLNWKVNPTTLLYVEAAEGYRLGGPNLPVGLTFEIPAPYKADHLWDYEFGWKTSWFENRVTFDGAFYYMSWSDIQQQGTDVTGAYTFITNAGAARAIGFEAEVTARPVSWLQFDLGTSETDAQLVGRQPFQPLAINTVRAGDPLPFVPRWTVNGGVTLNYRLGDEPAWFRAETSYQSGRTTAFDPVSPAYAKLPDWYLVNLSAGVKLADRYALTIFVRNLLDKVTYVSGSYNAQTPLVINSTPPRTVGATLSVSF